MAVESAAEEAGMMEEGKVPVILAPFFLVSSFTPSFIISFIHSWHVFVCYCQNLKTGRENSNHANQQMLGRFLRWGIMSHNSLGIGRA